MSEKGKFKTDYYGQIVKLGDILTIKFGNMLIGQARVIGIDNDNTLHFTGIGSLRKANGKYGPINND